MGAELAWTDTGVEIELHRFDACYLGEQYLASRDYLFAWNINPIPEGPFRDRTTSGFDIYRGPLPGERAALRKKDGLWQVAFWIEGDVRVKRDGTYSGALVWRGEYRVEGKWEIVCNGSGRPIAYADAKAAAAGALWSLQELIRQEIEKGKLG